MTKDNLVKSINGKCENNAHARFTPIVVIQTINECLRELSSNTNLYSLSNTINLVNNQVIYPLSDELLRPSRAVYKGKKITFISQDDMDYKEPLWEDKIAYSDTLLYIILGNTDEEKEFRVYPQVETYEVNTLKLYGTRLPDEVVEETVEVDVNDLHINTVIYYVAGTLLMNTGRTEDITRGAFFLNEYLKRLKTIQKSATRSSYESPVVNGPFRK